MVKKKNVGSSLNNHTVMYNMFWAMFSYKGIVGSYQKGPLGHKLYC